ncbi:MAG: agmatinase family protein, partial [Bacteroidia bacterium]|nr:agmatinase family protein [Bacteroidia bacterium]
MNRNEKIKSFNPNDIGKKGANLFGLPFTTDEARVVVIPVPWEVTVSYGGGTIEGPEAVFEASAQVDLFDPFLPNAWKLGVAMDEIPKKIKSESKTLRKAAAEYLAGLTHGDTPESHTKMAATLNTINEACANMVNHVKEKALYFLNKKKLVVLLGGDHSTPLGYMQALATKHKEFGVLHIDAHADLRKAYEGFEYSHASIFYNALKIKELKKLVQVGIRDYCEDEYLLAKNSKGRVKTYYDKDIKRSIYKGKKIADLHREIISNLPQKVYVSFDIDGLDPKLCPNTGTPVPGGFEFEEACHLLEVLATSGRTIIGCDINEVSPGKDEWDANVGSRLLFR